MVCKVKSNSLLLIGNDFWQIQLQLGNTFVTMSDITICVKGYDKLELICSKYNEPDSACIDPEDLENILFCFQFLSADYPYKSLGCSSPPRHSQNRELLQYGSFFFW